MTIVFMMNIVRKRATATDRNSKPFIVQIAASFAVTARAGMIFIAWDVGKNCYQDNYKGQARSATESVALRLLGGLIMSKYLVGKCPKCGAVNAAAVWMDEFTTDNEWQESKDEFTESGLIVTETTERVGLEGCECKNSCKWSQDDHEDVDTGSWATACGNRFYFTDGGPDENEFKFCNFCGKPIIVSDFVERLYHE